MIVVVDECCSEERVVTVDEPDFNPVDGLPYEEVMRCDQAGRRSAKRAKLAKRGGTVAVVLEVPMQECPACGERWLDWEVGRRLDVMLNAILAGDVEVATRHYEEGDYPAA